ncbi:MAG: MotA/TolQ/ExbB proton channel family protein [Prevotella pectinovora]|uniref:MotA/TolQ/ExbB proton channel family protein n=1 Tax=Prevotella pectinovora TaxID=1602169 RepID=UPI002A802ACE|nr:MotA/TolQ/ExbB proton channel family protein [Prevotella pectinovora]MDY4778346.1 MotA/TolQ/ExbB proton channel family protein [Prevotella pectinovora]
MQRLLGCMLIIISLVLAAPADAAAQDKATAAAKPAAVEKTRQKPAAAKSKTAADNENGAAPAAASEAAPAANAPADSLGADDTQAEATDTTDVAADLEGIDDEEPLSFHQVLKTKFIEGSAGFMSLVALALVLGLAFCVERIIFLTLSEIDAKRMMADIDGALSNGDLQAAQKMCEQERGPVASICRKALARIAEPIDNIERGISSYGSVEAANMEKGCSWIKLFIAIAPSLGFLGTVIGMVMAFEQIQDAGDISPTIVASGMKVALITTIFGIIAALVLQVFYNYIVSKIDHITADMEESAIKLLDSIGKYKNQKG